MTNTKQLIDAIQSGNSADIEASFNSVMAEKVSNALHICRMAVTEKMFGEPDDADDSSVSFAQ